MSKLLLQGEKHGRIVVQTVCEMTGNLNTGVKLVALDVKCHELVAEKAQTVTSWTKITQVCRLTTVPTLGSDKTLVNMLDELYMNVQQNCIICN